MTVIREQPKPTFIIIGAARSGTTSLYNWCRQHPQIFMSPIKETNYFSDRSPNFLGPGDEEAVNKPIVRRSDDTFEERHAAIITSRELYLELFKGSENFLARGEISPSYLYYPSAAGNIYGELPDCKILILLRNPIDRAFSNYKSLFVGDRETLDFESALEMEDERIKNGWEFFWALKGIGLYASQVERYLKIFPREQVGIWLYEDLKADPESFYREVCRFIGVDDTVNTNFYRKNPSRSNIGTFHSFIRKRPRLRAFGRRVFPQSIRTSVRNIDRVVLSIPITMHSDTKARLQKYFEPDICCLHNMLPELNVLRWLEE